MASPAQTRSGRGFHTRGRTQDKSTPRVLNIRLQRDRLRSAQGVAACRAEGLAKADLSKRESCECSRRRHTKEPAAPNATPLRAFFGCIF
jgi:hypothetical protein